MFYRLLLSKETFHKVNRCILLFTAIASFVLPFCVITYTKTEVAAQRAFSVEVGMGGGLQMSIIEEPSYFEQNWWQIILLTVMIIGALFVAFKTIYSIYKVKKIIREGEHQFLLDGTEIVLSDEAKGCPFSWMHYIVMSAEDMNDSCRSIIRHEQGHIEYGHSWDIIITDLLTSIQWFNPAIWMLRSDLRALHEYQADDYALRSGINIKEYQLLLIKKAISMSGYSVANGFNHSILKNRITMMLSRKSSVRGLMKALYLIPAVGISLTAFAETKTIYVTAEDEVTNSVTDDKGTENPVLLQEDNNLVEETPIIDGDEDEVVMMPEEMPKFPGGDEALRKYIAGSIKYPEEAKNQGIQGRVFVSFVVSKEGDVKDVKIARSASKYLEAEAMRVVSAMPKWTPGKQKGEAVNVSFVVPINFVIPDPKTAENAGASDSGIESQAAEEEQVFVMVEEFPVFPGGDVALRKFLADSVKYPEEAKKQGIQGRVFVNFIVDKEGYVKNVKVAKKINEYLDAEAVRVVSSMPRWTPGKQRGEAVSVSYTVPIKFALGENETGISAQEAKSHEPNPDMTDWTFIIDGKKGTFEDMKAVDINNIVYMDEREKEKTAYVYLRNPNGPTKIGDMMSTASYPGGDTEMRKFIAANVKYPLEAQEKGLTGKLFVQFMVNEDGSVGNVEVMGNDAAQILKDEAVRVIKSMGKFIPATRDGKNINAYLGTYFKFALQDKEGNVVCDTSHPAPKAIGVSEITILGMMAAK